MEDTHRWLPHAPKTKNNNYEHEDEIIRKYFLSLDNRRASEYFHAIRRIRKNSFRIPLFKATFIPERESNLVIQAEEIAEALMELKQTEKR